MYRRILVPFDGSATAREALASAIGLARETGGQLRLVHVVEESAYLTGYDIGAYSGALLNAMRDTGQRVLAEGAATAQQAGVPVVTELIEQMGERLGESIARCVRGWNADLVVVGTHGRRGFGRVVLGSGAEQIIREAAAPVLVIRSPDA